MKHLDLINSQAKYFLNTYIKPKKKNEKKTKKK